MSNSQLRCLVTGGAGFIGSHLVRRLLELGHEVRVVDNLSTGFRANLVDVESDIDFHAADLRDREVCDRVTRSIDIVFHVAALPSVPRSIQDPVGCHENNVNATINLLEASRAAGVQRLVYSGSSSAYGDTPILPKAEQMEPLPRSPYAAAKLAGELYTLAYARAGMLEGVALRYFNVFGPRQDPNGPYAAVVPALFRAASSAEPMAIYGDGLQTRDFTYIDNVVAANLLAATQPSDRVNGWVCNVGAGVRTSLLDLIRLVSDTTGQQVYVNHCPPRDGDVRDSLASLTRAREVLGYDPVVTLPQGVQRLWAWLKSNPERAAAESAAR